MNFAPFSYHLCGFAHNLSTWPRNLSLGCASAVRSKHVHAEQDTRRYFLLVAVGPKPSFVDFGRPVDLGRVRCHNPEGVAEPLILSYLHGALTSHAAHIDNLWDAEVRNLQNFGVSSTI